ncbi:serine/threonine protein kinase [Nonomuraea fuscirosea]|uniref:serine/threonine protein kinase n=1 Tax=Nonomuraea fuscirosea TaxID=1291556 RepID=UPI0033C83286
MRFRPVPRPAEMMGGHDQDPELHHEPDTVGTSGSRPLAPVDTGSGKGEPSRSPVPPDVPNGWFVGSADGPDQYELLGEGMAGGEGITWKARYRGELASPLPLAVKLLRRPHNALPGWPPASELQRWRDYGVLLRHLKLDHVVRLDDAFRGAAPHPRGRADATGTDTMVYLVMEWVEGPTLHARLAGTRADTSTLGERLGCVAQVAETLAGLLSTTRSGGNPSLHRDVKPGNCIIHAERGLVLIDVSTLRLIDDGYDDAGRHTPSYTAPEVLAAPHLPRAASADVYSLGALAFFCLTGDDPPPADSPGAAARIAATLRAVVEAAGVPHPDRLTAHVLTALDSDPARRPTDLRDWSDGLLEAAGSPEGGSSSDAADVRQENPRSPRRRLVFAITVPILLVVLIAILVPNILTRTSGAGSGHERATSPATDRLSPAPTSPQRGETAAAPVRPTGHISSPPDRSNVKQCSYFSGTASLPPGITLALSKSDPGSENGPKYLEVVHDYEKLKGSTTWQGAQYFGTPEEGAVGKDFRVDLLAVPIESARRYANSGVNSDELVRSGTLLATVRVHRVAGELPHACEDSSG